MHATKAGLTIGALLALCATSACRSGELRTAPPTATATAAPTSAPALAPAPTSAPEAGASLAGEDADPMDSVARNQKSGAARWKDTGVYVDGQPVGVLSFGELPVTLQPVWKQQQASAPKRPHSDDPGYRIVKQRYYRFTDYLTALGVDLRKVKELHVYGPHISEAIVVSGAELRARGKDFLFHFGGEVWGKPIPLVPRAFGNGKSPDKITGVMVYIDKAPPKLVYNEGMELDGQPVDGIPYYGEPMRGGIRIYLDDRLATVIKRRLLDASKPRWKLFDFLAAQGIDTSRITEAWLIRDERRREKIGRAELEAATFESSPAARGQILIGDAKIPASALALHSRPVRDDQLPTILPDEDATP